MHLFHVLHVLLRQFGHLDIEDVQVMLANQVQQQIQRPFEGFQVHLQCIRRNVEICRQLLQRFAVQPGTCLVR